MNEVMEYLSLTMILVDRTVCIRQALSAETVAAYVEAIDDLPAVVLFRLSDGRLLLADGFHRHAASLSAGRKQIAAEIRDGDRQAAEAYACVANLRHGRALTRQERNAAILRLKRIRKLGVRAIAREMGLSGSTVSRVIGAEQVRRIARSARPPIELSDAQVDAVVRHRRSEWPSKIEGFRPPPLVPTLSSNPTSTGPLVRYRVSMETPSSAMRAFDQGLAAVQQERLLRETLTVIDTLSRQFAPEHLSMQERRRFAEKLKERASTLEAVARELLEFPQPKLVGTSDENE